MVAIPVGTIVAYAADPAKLKDSGWILCDGTTLPTKDYNDLARMLHPSSTSQAFKIPDLRGRFLRGADTNFPPGKAEEWMTSKDPDHPIFVTFGRMATGHNSTSKLTGAGAYSMIDWKGGSTDFTVNQFGGDAPVPIETRPINTYLHYIIKARKIAKDDLPPAAVIPFAGGNASLLAVPDFIRCDGSTALLTDGNVSKLDEIMGKRFDPRQHASDDILYAPDLTGKFIRGVDPISTRPTDPDQGKRNSAPDGSDTGLGTWQDHDTAFKEPKVHVAHFSTSTHGCPRGRPHEGIHSDDYSKEVAWGGGAVETRPKNAAVHFYLSSLGEGMRFPIGGIIAIPGLGNPDIRRWLLCDGKAFSNEDEAVQDLFNVIGFTWGHPAQDRTKEFCLPDLRGYFLRGADMDGLREHADPEYNERFTLRYGGSKLGPGSYQNAAVAFPKTRKLKLEGDFDYPTSEISNPQYGGLGSNDIAEWKNSDKRSFELDWTNDVETAPTFVSANFYICFG